MQLSPRQRQALEEICATFCSSEDSLPSPRELGVVDAVLAAVDKTRPAEQRQLAALLSIWDTPAMGALGGVGLRHFSAMGREQREQVMRSWGDSRVPQRRAVYQALRKAALLFYYVVPGRDGRRNPAWDAIGYDGPLGRLPDAPPRPLRPTAIERETTLDCDVVIVGSGAGGGAAAGVLAEAGLEVVVIESGGYCDDQDFDGSELKAWAAHGVSAFTSDDYTASLDAVCKRLGVNQEHNEPSTRDQKLRDGCVKLGWHVDAMPRGVRQCAQGQECGYCGLGCRVGAKQSVVKTWLADAHARGTRLVVGTKVERVVVAGGSARGVVGQSADGHRLTVNARAVIASCGAIHTPALLRRSGLRNENIGQHLKLHPAGAVFGVFDEVLKPWEGVMQALYSDQFRDLHGGYGLKFETAAQHPHLLVPFSPWRSAADHFRIMEAISNTTPVGVLLRDRDGGEVRVGRDGEPVVRYKLSRFDAGHLRAGIDGAAQMLESAGARRIFSSHSRWVSYDPGRSGSRARFMADADAAGYGSGQCGLNSFHIMGSAGMGGSSATSACDPAGQTWDVRDLYVLDGSSFPTASGVNPQISIQAIAHMSARGLAARLA